MSIVIPDDSEHFCATSYPEEIAEMYFILSMITRLATSRMPTDPLAGLSLREQADLPPWHEPAPQDGAEDCGGCQDGCR